MTNDTIDDECEERKMTKDDYTIKGEMFDISETMTAVSISNADGLDSGKFVLKLESEDGTEVSIVMNYIQAVALRSSVGRIGKKEEIQDARRQEYYEEAPSVFTMRSEVEILLSDGMARTFEEIIRDVAFGLALSTEYYDGRSDYCAYFYDDIDIILTSMAEDGMVESLRGDAYRMTDTALAEMRAKEFRDQMDR